MKSRRSLLTVLFIVVSLTGAFLGCSQSTPPAPPPAAIQYEIGQGAELTKLTWYMLPGDAGPVLWLDITYKNVSGAERAFEVGAKVDVADVIDGSSVDKKLKAGAEQTSKIGTGLTSSRPSSILIRIKPL